ncbi:MAG: rhodanese-like domain-containing protein [Bdellovibrionales bacterium]|nr:rhodanese-like domain-containing protein [Bdellovibrionales bacterium]
MNHDFISAHEVEKKLQETDACKIIDVREFSEFANENIQGSQHTPLSKLTSHIEDLSKDHTYYILCKSGNRACKAADELHARGFENFKVIQGGIEGWKQAGLPIQKGQSNVWSLERQVRMTAGALVTIGLTIGAFFHPYGYLVSAFVGVGLMFSAISDTCTMGLLLAKMPWNQK